MQPAEYKTPPPHPARPDTMRNKGQWPPSEEGGEGGGGSSDRPQLMHMHYASSHGSSALLSLCPSLLLSPYEATKKGSVISLIQ